MFLILVRLACNELIVHLDTLRRRVAHALDLPVVVLHLYLFQPLVRDLPEHVVLATLLLVGSGRRADYLGRRFRRLRADFASLRVFAAAYWVRRVFHLLLLVVVVLLLLMRYYRLVRLEVFTNSLIDSLLADFVIVGRLHFNHVFQIIDVICIELRVL